MRGILLLCGLCGVLAGCSMGGRGQAASTAPSLSFRSDKGRTWMSVAVPSGQTKTFTGYILTPPLKVHCIGDHFTQTIRTWHPGENTIYGAGNAGSLRFKVSRSGIVTVSC